MLDEHDKHCNGIVLIDLEVVLAALQIRLQVIFRDDHEHIFVGDQVDCHLVLGNGSYCGVDLILVVRVRYH